MNSNKSVTANFSQIGATQFDLTTNVSGQGSVNLNPSGGTYDSGTVVAVTATPASGWQFDGWSGDLSGSQNPANITMNSNKSVTANFSQISSGGDNVGYDDQSIFDRVTTAATRRAQPVTMPENGIINTVSMYHDGGSGDMILAVYEGDSEPTNLLSKTAVTAVNGSAGWQTINLSSSIYVSGNKKIWLAWVYENNPGIHYTAGTPGRAASTDTWSGGMPGTFGSSSASDWYYAIYASYTPGSAVGQLDVYTDKVTTNGTRRAQPVTISTSGTIKSLSMYHDGGSGSMILAIYDGSSAPANRIATTGTVTVSGNTGWQTVNLTTPVSVQAGQQLWFAWVYENNPGIYYKAGTPGRAASTQTWSGGMPSTFGSSSNSDWIYSIYAIYE